MRIAKTMRYLLTYFLTLWVTLVGAQTELGISGGLGFSVLTSTAEPGEVAELDMRYPSPSVLLSMRTNTSGPVGFAWHLGYTHKAITGEWRESTKVWNHGRDGDFTLHMVRSIITPEFTLTRSGRTALRTGLDLRWAFSARFSGEAKQFEPYGPSYSAADTTFTYGSGYEAMVFLGLRTTLAANERWSSTVEPYFAFAPLTSLFGGGPRTRWVEFGAAVGVGRKRKARTQQQPAG